MILALYAGRLNATSMYLAMNLLNPVPIACSATMTRLIPNHVPFVIMRNMYLGNSENIKGYASC